MRSGLWTVLALLSSAASACSGPGAQSAMATARATGMLYASAAVLLGTFSWFAFRARQGAFAWPVVLTVLAITHPGWYTSVYSGDCGMGDIMLSLIVTATCAILFAAQAVTQVRDARRVADDKRSPLKSGH